MLGLFHPPIAMGGGNKAGELRVGIIGAGVSGLACCKQCTENGLNATVFEGKSGLGGVWKVSYSSTKLQSPKNTYAFSDFPWPESVPIHPSNTQVVDYLESYARHFGFLDKIRFNSQVVEVKKTVKPSGKSGKSSNSGNASDIGSSRISSYERVGGQEEHQLVQRLISQPRTRQTGDWSDNSVLWEVCVRSKVPGLEGRVDYLDEWHTFDYLIMCCGLYGDIARLPSFPTSKGPEAFRGRVLHSLDYSALDSKSTRALLSGKKVVVVGSQKTALDIAVEVANINQGFEVLQPCTLLFRRAHWMFPRHRQAFGLFNFGYLFSTRFSNYMTRKPGQDFTQSMMQTTFSPLKLMVWKLLEYYLQYTVPVARYGLQPDHSLWEGLSACVLPQVPQNLLRHLSDGHIMPKKVPSWDFYEKGVRLANGTRIEADVVILCTGYDGKSKLKAIFPEDERALLFEPEGVLSLYRGIIHPQIPNMGFVGYLEGLSSVHSAEMAAMWLAQLLRKRIALPDVATMEDERMAWIRHCKRSRFFSRTSACVATMQIWHADKLCKDMGFKAPRKKTQRETLFSMYNSSDYKGLSS